MKSKSLLFLISCFGAALFVFFISCHKGNLSDVNVSKPAESLTLTDAKQYFDLTLIKKPLNNVLLSTFEKKAAARVNPLWSKAKAIHTSLYNMVEVPFVSGKMYYTMYTFGAKGSPDRSVDQSVIQMGFKRLVIYKDKSGMVDQRIVTYLPDHEYLSKHGNDASGNWVNRLDNDFSGYLEYSNWDQKVLFVLRIEHGKAVRKRTVETSIYTETGSKSGVVVNSLGKTVVINSDCTECYPVFGEECTTVLIPDRPDIPPVTNCDAVITGQNCVSYDCGDDPPDPCLDPANVNAGVCVGTGGGGTGTGTGTGGSGGGPIVSVNISNLPTWGPDLTQTYSGSCVFMNMEIVSDILGLNYNEDGLISNYASITGQSISFVQSNGIPISTSDNSQLINFLSNYFAVTSIGTGQIVSSINQGNPVMAFILTGFDMNSSSFIGHEITVYGYSTDSSGNTTYNYIDTSDGSSQVGNGNNFGSPVSISKK